MSQSLFQKEFNDEISVRDQGVDNPHPVGLDMRVESDCLVFFARPGFVLKSIYSSLDSLDAFSSDSSMQLYMFYSRDEGPQNAVFIQHDTTPSEEMLTVLSIWDLSPELQSCVPSVIR